MRTECKQIEDYLVSKVNASGMGTGITIAKQARDGSVILKFNRQKYDLKTVQAKIQGELGGECKVRESLCQETE